MANSFTNCVVIEIGNNVSSKGNEKENYQKKEGSKCAKEGSVGLYVLCQRKQRHCAC